MSRIERERLKRVLRSWNCCNLPATMTMPNSDLQHPLHQPAKMGFLTPVTVPSLLTFTSSECHRVIRSQVQEQHVPPEVNPDTWPAPICLDEREKAFVMPVENGAAVEQPNIHQRALCQAEAIEHPVKYQRTQWYKKCQLYT